jgi:hypothetical protein
VQQDCEPPCGPDKSCCSGKQVQPSRGARGEEIWTCEPVEPPPPRPSWLDPDGCRNPTKTNCLAQGYFVGRLDLNMIICERTFQACGRTWRRRIGPLRNQAGVCPPCPIPFPELCCGSWTEAERTKEPCDPAVDADCDGVSNEQDADPFAPAPQ